MKRNLVALSLCVPVVAACGDDGPKKSTDAAPTDEAQPIDSKIFLDAPVDAPPPANAKILVGDQAGIVQVFNITDSGDVAPQRSITGSATNMSNPYGITFIPNANEIVVANF